MSMKNLDGENDLNNVGKVENRKMMQRNAGIEIMRIVAMLWIIAFHFTDHGTVLFDKVETISLNWWFLAIGRMGGGVGNCLFVLISGYLLFEKDFKLRRVLKLWLEVLFYSIVCGLFSIYLSTDSFSFDTMRRILTPISSNEYWFMTTYVLLMLLSPFIQRMLNTLSEKEFQRFIFLSFLLFSLLPTLGCIFPRIFDYERFLVDQNRLFIFIVLYSIGAYIKVYGVPFSKKVMVRIGMITFSVIYISFYVIHNINLGGELRYDPSSLAWGLEKAPVVLLAVAVFSYIIMLPIKMHRIIAFFSSSVFAVYLLHIGRLRTLLFKVFDDGVIFQTYYFVIWYVLSVVVIFVGAVLIDKLRVFVVERLVQRIIGHW